MRPRCAHCERPLATCLCALIGAPTPNEVELLVLQHPSEAAQAKGTATLLRLGLANCQVLVGERFEAPAAAPGRQDLLLYPAPRGEAAPAPTSADCCRLIVLDATWRKSRLMLYQNPWLAELPRLALNTVEASRYAPLRKAQRPGQLATLEAALLALENIEACGSERYAPLWQAFDAFVARSARPVPQDF